MDQSGCIADTVKKVVDVVRATARLRDRPAGAVSKFQVLQIGWGEAPGSRSVSASAQSCCDFAGGFEISAGIWLWQSRGQGAA